MDWNLENIISRFQLSKPQSYDAHSLKHVFHSNNSNFRKAAVLVGFIERNNRCYILFTKRAAHLKHHPGQISFPGGKFEHYDQNLFSTAIRETYEEIGIPHKNIEIFGSLPELITTSGFQVTPVLAKISASFPLVIDKNEVCEVFEIPAEYLFDRRNMKSNMFKVHGHFRKLFFLPYNNHLIWGVTGQIIDILQRQFQNRTFL